MPSDETRTATLSLHGGDDVEPLGLVIAYHRDERFEGSARVLPAGENLVLGRNCTSFVPGAWNDSRVSRRHVAVARLGSELTLRDLDSRNGTFVDGQRLDRGPLRPGQVLSVGRVVLVATRFPVKSPRRIATDMIGVSTALMAAIELVDRVASRDLPVLILGESGVGKELIARQVHDRSARPGSFVPVNCAGVPDTLLQDELFGHVRGAFSGAETARRGLVDEARRGTLFLDEIGDASLNLQGSMLRLLQDREVRAIGSDRTTTVDVRFVAATNAHLAEAVREGTFREDLYARLNRIVVRIPPLRERREDIMPLARHFAREFAGRRLRFDFSLGQALVLHDWPGNARSLQGIVERLVIEQEGEEVLAAPSWLADELAMHARKGEKQKTEAAPAPKREIDGDELRALLKKHQGKVTAVASELGIGRNTLYRWLRKYNIDIEDYRVEG
jgi:transcriptional regulator with PAS, ATPase and Fis domain